MLGVWMVLMLTACGGGGSSGSLPTADGSRTEPVRPSVTVSLPSRSPSSAGPTSGPTSTSPPTSTAPTSTAPTSTAPPAQQKDQSEPADDSTIPSWVWWVLVAVGLAAAGAAALLVPRARKRTAWRADLAVAEGEVAWFARELLPRLQQARSLDEVAGGWQVAQGRVTAVEDRLTALETTAPDEPGTARARDLRDAVRTARRGIETLVTTRADPFFTRELGAITTDLTAALDPVVPSS